MTLYSDPKVVGRGQRKYKCNLFLKMDDEDEEYDVLQKVLIIGDTSVGKVCRLVHIEP